jgi:hypothetical protein
MAKLTEHNTLTTTAVDTVTLSSPCSRVTVSNRAASGAADIWFTVGANDVAPTDPVALADDTYWVPAGGFKTVRGGGNKNTIVKVVGNANEYSVEGEQWGAP